MSFDSFVAKHAATFAVGIVGVLVATGTYVWGYYNGIIDNNWFKK